MDNKERALLVAERAHHNQTYDGIYPYIFHIKQVIQIATSLGYDDTIIIACTLHDILEDTNISYNDIRKAFGNEIAEIVYAVTDELGRNRRERKEKTYPKIKANYKATIVKICDRIANLKHSHKTQSRMLKMYVDENINFFNSIYDPTHPDIVNKAWNKLNQLIYN